MENRKVNSASVDGSQQQHQYSKGTTVGNQDKVLVLDFEGGDRHNIYKNGKTKKISGRSYESKT